MCCIGGCTSDNICDGIGTLPMPQASKTANAVAILHGLPIAAGHFG